MTSIARGHAPGRAEQIRDLRHQVIQLTLAAAVLAQGQAQAAAEHPAPDNVVPLRPDSS